MTFNDPAVFGLMAVAALGGTISSILFAFETAKETGKKHTLPYWKGATTLFILSGVLLLLKLLLLYDFILYIGYMCILLGFIVLLIEILNLEMIRKLLIRLYTPLRRIRWGIEIPRKPWHD